MVRSHLTNKAAALMDVKCQRVLDVTGEICGFAAAVRFAKFNPVQTNHQVFKGVDSGTKHQNRSRVIWRTETLYNTLDVDNFFPNVAQMTALKMWRHGVATTMILRQDMRRKLDEMHHELNSCSVKVVPPHPNVRPFFVERFIQTKEPDTSGVRVVKRKGVQ